MELNKFRAVYSLSLESSPFFRRLVHFSYHQCRLGEASVATCRLLSSCARRASRPMPHRKLAQPLDLVGFGFRLLVSWTAER